LKAEGSEEGQVEDVQRIFNEMADEYDHLRDLWYRYTFGMIDGVLVRKFRHVFRPHNKPLALDVGCGTGIQSIRLASMGYKVIGLDVAEDLLRVAHKRSKKQYHDSEFLVADAQSLPISDSTVECANCCGPTLSFVPDWRRSLSEISRCLKPGGQLLLEVEGKWNLDLFWEIVNAVGFNFLGYNTSLSAALSHLVPPWDVGHLIRYSFKLESGESVEMPLKLFSATELRRELQNANLVEDKRWGLHVVTNLVPSTILHGSNPSRLLRLTFGALAAVETRVNDLWPLNALGCSLLVLAHKTSGQRTGPTT